MSRLRGYAAVGLLTLGTATACSQADSARERAGEVASGALNAAQQRALEEFRERADQAKQAALDKYRQSGVNLEPAALTEAAKQAAMDKAYEVACENQGLAGVECATALGFAAVNLAGEGFEERDVVYNYELGGKACTVVVQVAPVDLLNPLSIRPQGPPVCE